MADADRPRDPRRYVVSLADPSDRGRFAAVFGLAGIEVTTLPPDRATLAPDAVLVTDIAVHRADGKSDGGRTMILALDASRPAAAIAFPAGIAPAVVLNAIRAG